MNPELPLPLPTGITPELAAWLQRLTHELVQSEVSIAAKGISDGTKAAVEAVSRKLLANMDRGMKTLSDRLLADHDAADWWMGSDDVK
jgi:hypothetical protein